MWWKITSRPKKELDESEILLKKLHALFAVVVEFVYESGGDGDGWIVSENYEVLADKFEKWRIGRGWKGSIAFPLRHSGDGYVTFEDNQESVSFVRDVDELPEWAGDIIIESKHFEFVA